MNKKIQRLQEQNKKSKDKVKNLSTTLDNYKNYLDLRLDNSDKYWID